MDGFWEGRMQLLKRRVYLGWRVDSVSVAYSIFWLVYSGREG